MAPPLPPPAPRPSLDQDFLDALGAGPRPAARPLPPAFEPLAAVVAGTTDVRIATGPAVRRALGDVGKQAATVGNVIHLAHAPADRPADLAIVGHELAHVAAPSARPRFLGGPPDGEERHAERVARTVQEATAGGTSGMRVGGGSLAGQAVHRIVQRAVDEALRRRPVPEPPQPAEPAPAAPPQVMQLAPPQPPPTETVIHRAPAIRRDLDPPPSGDGGDGNGLDFDQILEALEERVLTELERRGGRLVEVL